MPVVGSGSGGKKTPRRAVRAIARPLRDFLEAETAGAVVLLGATVIALALSNSPLRAGFESLWGTDFAVPSLQLDLRHWVNEGLMTIFFLVVGLEIKRELVAGELNDIRKAALPVIAAVGGVLMPALIYAVLNGGGEGGAGWGIPTATDIAFAVGVLALFGPRVPSGLKVFLLSLAIVDDVVAIVLIAAFYSEGVNLVWLSGGAAAIAAIGLLRVVRARWTPAFVFLGVATWVALLQSGVHPTLAGVAIALLTRARTSEPGMSDETPAQVWGKRLHPWTTYLVVPLFALANAGVELDIASIRDALASPIAAGIAFGLVAGKMIGITGASWLAVKMKVASLPDEVDWSHIVATSAVAGIGFTVSLFIATLAFSEEGMVMVAKVGILGGSLVAGILGAWLLLIRTRATTPIPTRSARAP